MWLISVFAFVTLKLTIKSYLLILVFLIYFDSDFKLKANYVFCRDFMPSGCGNNTFINL